MEIGKKRTKIIFFLLGLVASYFSIFILVAIAVYTDSYAFEGNLKTFGDVKIRLKEKGREEIEPDDGNDIYKATRKSLSMSRDGKIFLLICFDKEDKATYLNMADASGYPVLELKVDKSEPGKWKNATYRGIEAKGRYDYFDINFDGHFDQKISTVNKDMYPPAIWVDGQWLTINKFHRDKDRVMVDSQEYCFDPNDGFWKEFDE